MSALIYFMVLIIAGWQVLALRHKKRSGGQIPRRQHLARAVRHPSARHRLTRLDSSCRSGTVSSTSPKLVQADFPLAIARLAVTAPTAPSRVSRRGRAIVVPLACH